MAQYKEYARAAKNSGKKELPFSDLNADLLSIVNPCNPTGNCVSLTAPALLRSYVLTRRLYSSGKP